MTLQTLSKDAVLAAFTADLTDAIAGAVARARATAASATHAESRSENDKDTRGLEESYLAAGQAQRAADLELELAALKTLPRRGFTGQTPITAGALVLLEDEDEAQQVVLIGTASGGRRVIVGGTTVHLVTPAAPIGRALLGRVTGDEVTLSVKSKKRVLSIVDVL